MAEDAGGEQPDHARDVIAVALQAREIEVARLCQIHLHAVDDLVQPLGGDAVGRERGLQGAGHRVLRVARKQSGHFVPPPGELGAGELRVRGLVHHVVHLAAKGVQRRDGAPSRRCQEQERVVETRPAGGGFLLAVFVRRHRARAMSRGQSNQRSTGRRRNTS